MAGLFWAFGVRIAKIPEEASIPSPNGDPAVLRISLIAAALLLLAPPSNADAQVVIRGSYGYGYPSYYAPYGSYYGGYQYNYPYGEWGYRSPYRHYGYRPYYGYSGYSGYPGYVVPSLPSGTGGAFGGSPNSGNYWYWLQQQANQGRIPQSTVNRMMYGNR